MDFRELRKMTDELPSIPKLEELKEGEGRKVEYSTLYGEIFGMSLFNNNKVAVQRTFMEKDSVINFHTHPCIEVMIVYEGELKILKKDGEEIILQLGDSIHLDVDEAHAGEALNDTWLIAVTVPADPGYPK